MAGPVRQPIDISSLSRYLEEHVPEIALPVTIQQFGYGQSNPTYQVTARDGHRYVLRKKPPGKLLSKTAHQVEREYRVIHGLQNTNVPVPRAYCLCEDSAVIGTSFYIMEFLDGRIFEDPSIPHVTTEEREQMWREAVRTLAKLHQVVPSQHGLSDFGKHDGFYNRQIKTLSTISASQARVVDIDSKAPVGNIPHFDDMVSFFRNPATQPDDRACVIHGDYKIDNLVFHKTEPRVIGILDDLDSRMNPAFAPSASSPGLPTRSQCIDWYAEVTGWNPQADLRWGDSFNVFRNSVIMQGIAARYALRQASSEKAKEYAAQMGPFGYFAWDLLQRFKEEDGMSRAKL
ncbi:MAG: hypothetical protein Q9191_005848 [Dirinaria sp. TL-2023a]